MELIVTNSEDPSNYRNRIRSDSIWYSQSVVEAVGMIINNNSENSELFSNSEFDFKTSLLAKISDWTSDHNKQWCNNW